MITNNKNYSNTKIYKIWSLLGDKIYIGSTTKEYLSQRIAGHRYDYNKYKRTNKRFITSFILFDEYGIENCSIELLQSKDCTNIDEVKQLEGLYIRNLVCVNRNIPDRTIKEYYEDNKETIKEQTKKYRDANKEANKEQAKKYRDVNKETIKEQKKLYYEANKEQINKYRDANKEKISIQKKEYYDANKEQINEQKRLNWQLKKEQKLTSLE